jgi:hypothetical protein
VGFDPSGRLFLIARTGDIIEVRPGDRRTVGRLPDLAYAFESMKILNNAGEFVFTAGFTDGSNLHFSPPL